MKVSRNFSQLQQCGRKNLYVSEAEVKAEINRIKQKRNVELRYYRCPFCKGYHLAKKKEKFKLK